MVVNPKAKTIFGLLILISVAALLRIVNLDHEPTSDEMYHLLAAESWVKSGTFATGDGQYTRASTFTRLIGLAHAATDGDLYAIRMLCVFIGVLLIAAVYLSVNRLIGNTEALIASTMLALMPGAIYLSQFIRFYSLHAFAFWCAAIALYVAVVEDYKTPKRIIFTAISLGLFSFAAHLQVTTFIGLSGIALWIICLAAPMLWQKASRLPRRARPITVAILATLIAIIALVAFKPASELVAKFLSASLWSSETHAGYYAIRLRDQFGFFWTLFPVAIVVSLAVRPKEAFFCSCVFVVAFVLHSMAGMRSERYIFYAMPFFVTIWSIALKAAVGYFNNLVHRQLGRLSSARKESYVSGSLPNLVTGLTVAWIVLMTPAVDLTARMILDKPTQLPKYWFYFNTSWKDARQTISMLAAESDIFLTSQGHHAYYYIGDFDVEISATGLSDFKDQEGGPNIDPRTGRLVIADLDSLRTLRVCNRSGVIVIHDRAWRRFSGVSDELADYIERSMDKVETPTEWGMHIYKWSARTTRSDLEQNAIEGQELECAR